jgi:hypothetical protein
VIVNDEGQSRTFWAVRRSGLAPEPW